MFNLYKCSAAPTSLIHFLPLTAAPPTSPSPDPPHHHPSPSTRLLPHSWTKCATGKCGPSPTCPSLRPNPTGQPGVSRPPPAEGAPQLPPVAESPPGAAGLAATPPRHLQLHPGYLCLLLAGAPPSALIPPSLPFLGAVTPSPNASRSPAGKYLGEALFTLYTSGRL